VIDSGSGSTLDGRALRRAADLRSERGGDDKERPNEIAFETETEDGRRTAKTTFDRPQPPPERLDSMLRAGSGWTLEADCDIMIRETSERCVFNSWAKDLQSLP
jgi:hypothetical protein